MTVLSGFWAQATILVSGVLVARILGVENRGHLALFWVIALILSQLGSLGLPLAIPYWIAKQPASARAIVRSLAWPVALQAGVLVCLHALTLYMIMGDEDHVVRLAAYYTVGVIPPILGQQYALALLQGQRRFRAFNVVRVLPATLYGAAILTLFLVEGSDLPTVALAWTSVYVLAGTASLAYAVARLPPKQDERGGKPSPMTMVRFGIKGLLGSASPLETFQLDQALVGLFISPAALGLYVVALAFTNLPRLIAHNIGFVAFPHVAGSSERGAARKTMWRFFGLTLVLCGSIVAALEATADRLVLLFFGPEFSDSTALVHILLIGALLAGLRRVLADGARGSGYPGLGTIAEIVSWAALLVALAFLVPAAGVRGVALALVTSSALGLAVLVTVVTLAGRRTAPEAITSGGSSLVRETAWTSHSDAARRAP